MTLLEHLQHKADAMSAGVHRNIDSLARVFAIYCRVFELPFTCQFAGRTAEHRGRLGAARSTVPWHFITTKNNNHFPMSYLSLYLFHICTVFALFDAKCEEFII